MRKLICCGVLLGCLGTALAQPSVGVMYIDGKGHLDALNQAEAQVNGGVGDPKLLLRNEVVKRLSYEQRQDLLHEPERLLACSRVREIFTTPRLLLLQPEKEGRVFGTYYDLEHQVREPLVADADQTSQAAREQLVKLAQKDYGPHSVAVLANPQSHRYHLRDAAHVNTDGSLIEMASSYQAEARGYQACTICFDGATRPLDQNDLERALGA